MMKGSVLKKVFSQLISVVVSVSKSLLSTFHSPKLTSPEKEVRRRNLFHVRNENFCLIPYTLRYRSLVSPS